MAEDEPFQDPLRESIRQLCIRAEWVREAFNALLDANPPGKVPYAHPMAALGRAVSALSVNREVALMTLREAPAERPSRCPKCGAVLVWDRPPSLNSFCTVDGCGFATHPRAGA